MMALRDELIQVAAVAVAIVTDLDGGSTVMGTDASGQAIRDVMDERFRQEGKWGAQHHTPAEWLVILGEEYGESCQAVMELEGGGIDRGAVGSAVMMMLLVRGADYGEDCRLLLDEVVFPKGGDHVTGGDRIGGVDDGPL